MLMKNAIKKIIKMSGITVSSMAAAAFTAYVTTKYLVRIALDRDGPKAMQKAENLISGSQSSNEFLKELKEAAKKLEEKGNETVKIVSHDGTSLAGHWIPCKNPKRVIIAMHGWRSFWSRDFGMIADFWEKNDCSVLYAEQRGQGGSGGDYIGFGPIERYDCLDWINWVIDRCGNEIPIYLGGVSMGATTVLMAAGLELPDNVHGIVGDCGFTSPHAIWKHVANNNLHIAFGLRGAVADTLYEKITQTDDADYSTVDALRNCSVPIMLIHGTDDHFVPVEMTYENYKACTSPKKLFIVPGADHGMSYYIDKEGYEAVIKDFWRRFD